MLGLIVLVAANPGKGQGAANSLRLPPLNVIQEVTLEPPYSCRSDQDFSKGYEKTALFLSGYSRQRNGPELLFNGACGSQDYFDVNTAGDSMSLIADLGADVSIETLTAQEVFNLKGVNSLPDYTAFSSVAKTVPGDTYAVVINTGDVRGLLVFTVVKFVPDTEVVLQFAVKDYQINLSYTRSPGFGWGIAATRQGSANSSALPDLNVIQGATLMPSYSCNPGVDASQGYGNTALFLSSYGRQQNSPELLFNGACGSEDYFQVSLAGDSMSLIADLGAEVSVESVTAQQAFNLTEVFSWSAYTPFPSVAKIVQGHTYAVVTDTDGLRGLFVFTVDKFVPDLEVDLRFAVKDYQANLSFTRSPGFDWGKGAGRPSRIPHRGI